MHAPWGCDFENLLPVVFSVFPALNTMVVSFVRTSFVCVAAVSMMIFDHMHKFNLRWVQYIQVL